MPGGWVDLIWPAGAVALAFAAWQPAQHRAAAVARGFRALVVPAAFTLLIAARFGLSPLLEVNQLAQLAAAATLVLIVARFALTMAENQQLVRRIETDPLTGLENRGKLLEDLRAVLAAREPRLLAIFDLDGFKAYNDTFGHPAGDTLSSRLAGRLQASVPMGSAYRIGGDEFCVMLPGDRDAETIEQAAVALSGQGDGFEVSASYGSVLLPEEASTPSAALQIADKRMYAFKDSRQPLRGRAGKGGPAAGPEREPARPRAPRRQRLRAGRRGRQPPRHGAQRADCACPRGRASRHRQGGDPRRDPRQARAARRRGWAFMSQHTILGERIVSSAPALAPVALIVRSSHEHFDGNGYPDGLAGEAIPLASRVILACDAYEAMTSHRPYAAALSDSKARRGAAALLGNAVRPAGRRDPARRP